MSISSFFITAGNIFKNWRHCYYYSDDCDGPGNMKDNHMGLGSIWHLPGPDFIKNQVPVIMVSLLQQSRYCYYLFANRRMKMLSLGDTSHNNNTRRSEILYYLLPYLLCEFHGITSKHAFFTMTPYVPETLIYNKYNKKLLHHL